MPNKIYLHIYYLNRFNFGPYMMFMKTSYPRFNITFTFRVIKI